MWSERKWNGLEKIRLEMELKGVDRSRHETEKKRCDNNCLERIRNGSENK